MFNFGIRKGAFMSEATVRADEAKAAVNYRVVGPTFFGDNARGTVIPRWVAELSGSRAETLVEDGTLEETDAPVVKSFRAPPPKTETDAVPSMVEDLNRVRAENVKFASDNRALLAENDALRAEKAAMVTGLGEQTAQVTHWRTVAEQHKKRVAELEAELALERDTRPPADGKPAKGKDKVAA